MCLSNPSNPVFLCQYDSSVYEKMFMPADSNGFREYGISNFKNVKTNTLKLLIIVYVYFPNVLNFIICMFCILCKHF